MFSIQNVYTFKICYTTCIYVYVYIFPCQFKNILNMQVIYVGGRGGTREPSSPWEYSYITLYITQGYSSQRLVLPYQTLSSLSNFFKAETCFLHCWIRAEVSLFHRRLLCWERRAYRTLHFLFQPVPLTWTQNREKTPPSALSSDHASVRPCSKLPKVLGFGSYYSSKALSFPQTFTFLILFLLTPKIK